MKDTTILSPKNGRLFFKLWIPLLAYANKKWNINPVIRLSLDADRPYGEDLLDIADRVWEDVSIIDEYLAQAEDMTEEHREIVASWKRRVRRENAILERHLKRGSIIIFDENTVYLAKGIQSSWEEMIMGRPLPVFIDVTLIPFKDVIISNGLVRMMNIHVGPNITQSFKDIYRNAKKEDLIRKSL